MPNAAFRLAALPVFAFVFSPAAAIPAADLRIGLPLGRTAYRTDEAIDLSVVRSSAAPLEAGELALVLAGNDGSRLSFIFPVPAAPIAGGGARRTEHLRIDARLLRPGTYAIEAAADGARAAARIEVFSHVRRSSFRLIDWGSRAEGDDLAKLGEEGLGFNLILGNYRLDRSPRNAEATLRGGADFMQCCTMSGGHQMDLRMECDWSDPYVVRGATARAVQQAFIDRTKPNALGVHFYDEPGLTWWKDPRTGRFTPHGIPAQDRAYRSAFGRDPVPYFDVKPGDPASVAAWEAWGRWKESFLEAAWRDARAAVEDVDPRFLTASQSQYAFEAFTDGHYFNVARSLPVISGHGGYDDGPASYFYPSFKHEFGRARDLAKPVWYLPVWYAGLSSENFRLEQYLSFMTGLQGMAKPPDHTVHDPASTPGAEGIVETNRLFERLGTIFTVLPAPREEVAVLYSLSQCLDAQIRSGVEDNYEGGGHSRAKLLMTYLASKLVRIPFSPIVEEDVLDGTLAAHHRAVVLAGIDRLDPAVVAGLATFTRTGGLVLVTADSKVEVPGAVRLAAPADPSRYELIERLWKTDQKASMRERGAARFLAAAEPLARALEEKLVAAGIRPIISCDVPTVVAARHRRGDIEYIFAVNATPDASSESGLAILPATATLEFPADGRPILDAVRGGPVRELEAGTRKGTFRFGPGGLRAFALPVRPIGGVRVGTPAVDRDFTVPGCPIALSATACIADESGELLAGAAPLRVRLVDPIGGVRHDLFRAADLGVLRIELPLAVNDPGGTWTLEVEELLSGKRGTATFRFDSAPVCPAAAGAVRRAISFGADRKRIFRFFRRHAAVTLVKGSSAWCADGASRIAEGLRPWGVRCAIVDAAAVNRPRELSEEEARTWVGLEFGRAEAGTKNSPRKVGFALEGPAVLVGSPSDNPLIAEVEKLGFLPYPAGPDFPGRGRGFISWQRDAVGIGIESIAVIASDPDGMAEAAGTLFEAAAGLEPLTPLELPRSGSVEPASRVPGRVPGLAVAWEAVLPDRAVALEVRADGSISAMTLDGSRTAISTDGRAGKAEPAPPADLEAARKARPVPAVPDALKAKLPRFRIAKRVEAGPGGRTAVAFWGGTLQVFEGAELRAQDLLPQDIAALAWSGARLVAGLADGRVFCLEARDR
jgi:hypothetical protein